MSYELFIILLLGGSLGTGKIIRQIFLGVRCRWINVIVIVRLLLLGITYRPAPRIISSDAKTISFPHPFAVIKTTYTQPTFLIVK